MANFSLNELLVPLPSLLESSSELQGDKLTTLEGFHNDRIRKFRDTRESLPQLRAELAELRSRLAGWSIESRFNDEHKEALDLETEINKRISDIESDKDQMNYYLNVGDIQLPLESESNYLPMSLCSEPLFST